MGERRVVWCPPEGVPNREDLEARVRSQLRDVPGNVTVYITQSGSAWSVMFEPASLLATFPSDTSDEERESKFEEARKERAEYLEPARLRAVAVLRESGLDAP